MLPESSIDSNFSTLNVRNGPVSMSSARSSWFGFMRYWPTDVWGSHNASWRSTVHVRFAWAVKQIVIASSVVSL